MPVYKPSESPYRSMLMPNWLEGDPAMAATTMVSPIGMAAAPMGRWLPRINLQRIAPKAWTRALFAPEEELIQKRVMQAADAARTDPEFMQNLFIARQGAMAQQSNTGVSLGQNVMQKTQDAWDAARRVQAAQQGVQAAQEQHRQTLLKIFRRRSDKLLGGQ